MPRVTIGECYRVATLARALPSKLRARARDWPAIVEYTETTLANSPLATLLTAHRGDALTAYAALGLARSLTSLALQLWHELGPHAERLPLGVLCRIECGRLRSLTAANLAARLTLPIDTFYELAGLLQAPGVAFLEVVVAAYDYDETDEVAAATAGAPLQRLLFDLGAPPDRPAAGAGPGTTRKAGLDQAATAGPNSSRAPPKRTEANPMQRIERTEPNRRAPHEEAAGRVGHAHPMPPAPVSESAEALATAAEAAIDDALDQNARQEALGAVRGLLAARLCRSAASSPDRRLFDRLFATAWEANTRAGRPATPEIRRQRFRVIIEAAADISRDSAIENRVAYFVAAMQRAGMLRSHANPR